MTLSLVKDGDVIEDMQSGGWIGIGFDGVLVEYHGNIHEVGPIIPAMLERVQRWLEEGRDVRIVSHRISRSRKYTIRIRDRVVIYQWCREYLKQELPVTDTIDENLIALYGTVCVQVEKNTGRIIV